MFIMNAKIFAPTRTEIWDFCHLKSEIIRQGWVPAVWTKRDLARFVGGAFAEAVAAYNRHKLEGSAIDPARHQEIALTAFSTELEPFLKAGVTLDQQDIDETKALLARAIEKFIPQDPLTKARGWDCKDIELELSNHGRARIDWGGVDPYGTWCQVDYKVKLSLEARWKDKEVERYRYSTQMMHYNWAYGEHLQHPIHRYYICLVVLAPRFYVELLSYEVDPELQQAWLASAQQKWADMEAQEHGARIPDMAAVHRGPYGDCEYLRACLEFRLDPTLIQTAYIQVRPLGKPAIKAGEPNISS